MSKIVHNGEIIDIWAEMTVDESGNPSVGRLSNFSWSELSKLVKDTQAEYDDIARRKTEIWQQLREYDFPITETDHAQ